MYQHYLPFKELVSKSYRVTPLFCFLSLKSVTLINHCLLCVIQEIYGSVESLKNI